jgi:hypothetical protein
MNTGKMDSEEVILEIGTEGGLLSVRRFLSSNGTLKFILIIDESTMADFLDKDNQIDLVKKYPPVETFGEAVRLMDKYPWREMHLVSVHPDYAEIIRRERKKSMSTHGQGTSAVAQAITPKLNERGYDVYYDHGKKGDFVGKIAISIDEKLSRENEISQLDIAIIKRGTNKIIALVEIEETTDNPKKLIGDIYTVLMGRSIHLPGRKIVELGKKPTLIIIGMGTRHDERNKYIVEKANIARSRLGTEISKIGNIVIESVTEKEHLEKILMEQIEEAIRRNEL